jgi:hypothetical protein
MIHPPNDSIYLPTVTFSELNAFSQNYLPFWPNNSFDAADLLRVLIVIVIRKREFDPRELTTSTSGAAVAR